VSTSARVRHFGAGGLDHLAAGIAKRSERGGTDRCAGAPPDGGVGAPASTYLSLKINSQSLIDPLVLCGAVGAALYLY
jgi:hypothetical protein